MLAYQDFPSFSGLPKPVAEGNLTWQCTSRIVGAVDPGEACVTAIPAEGRGLVLEFRVLDTVMQEEGAEEWLADFEQTIARFLDSPDALLNV